MNKDAPVRIRYATPDDAAALLAIYGPYVMDTTITFECVIPSVQDYAKHISKLSAAYPFLAAECGGTLIGYAYASRYRERHAYTPSVLTSIYIAPDAQRKRLGKALYHCLLLLLKAQGYSVAFAAITIPNPPSAALHASMGFTPAGLFRKVGYKLGAWHDVMWMEKELAERIGPPKEPKAVCEIDPGFVESRFAEAEKRIRLSSISGDSHM